MSPYPTTGLQMRVSSLTADKNGNVTVAWSQASGMTALSKGADGAEPADQRRQRQRERDHGRDEVRLSVGVRHGAAAADRLQETYYLHPRLSTQVTCADC